jgi:transcriptional repressor NrdR
VTSQVILAPAKQFKEGKTLTNTIYWGILSFLHNIAEDFIMNCPYCSYHDSKVIDSRDVNEGIRRRRQCLSCGSRFTTYERQQPTSLFVTKKDERREKFSRDKLLAGIRKACEKRPLPTGTVDKLADDIEAELYHLSKVEIPNTVIGDMVMERLKSLDYIAYIRFASVYREFTDITALKKEIDTLVSTEAKTSPSTTQLPLLPDNKLPELAKSHRRSRQ